MGVKDKSILQLVNGIRSAYLNERDSTFETLLDELERRARLREGDPTHHECFFKDELKRVREVLHTCEAQRRQYLELSDRLYKKLGDIRQITRLT